ncbi:MAG TPA: TetR/AcrR family transcriptional regulator [Parvibaculum sp.]
MIDLEPKKLPKQTRSKASFEAIIDASAQLLRASPYEALTTNHIAERAGVSIGTLYEFFPNKEAIIAALTARLMKRLVENMQEAFIAASRLDAWNGVAHLTGQAVNAIAADRVVFHVLLRQISFVQHLPVVEEARTAMTALAQTIRVQAGDALDLPMPEQDAWLIAQMLYNTILEIAFLDLGEDDRKRMTRELARLVYRMAVGRDPDPDGPGL